MCEKQNDYLAQSRTVN